MVAVCRPVTGHSLSLITISGRGEATVPHDCEGIVTVHASYAEFSGTPQIRSLFIFQEVF